MEGLKTYKCWICKDQGLVIYSEAIEGLTYEIAARCSCIRGQSSWDRIGLIDPSLAEIIARDNLLGFKKINPDISLEDLRID